MDFDQHVYYAFISMQIGMTQKMFLSNKNYIQFYSFQWRMHKIRQIHRDAYEMHLTDQFMEFIIKNLIHFVMLMPFFI